MKEDEDSEPELAGGMVTVTVMGVMVPGGVGWGFVGVEGVDPGAV